MKALDGRRLIAESGLDYFKAASTFGALSDDAIRFLLSNGEVGVVDTGETVFRTGDPGNSFIVVLKGKLGYYWQREGQKVLIRDVGFGSQIGYVAMIGLLDREGTAVATEPSIYIKISSDLFYQLHLDYPSDFGILMLNLSREMARSIRTLNGRLTALAVKKKECVA